MNAKLPLVARLLAAAGWLELQLGRNAVPGSSSDGMPDRMRTRFRVAEATCGRLVELDLSAASFGLSEDEEVILLRQRKLKRDEAGPLCSYNDTPATHRYRESLRRINRWIAAAPLEYLACPLGEHAEVDTTERRLRRIFCDGSFKSHGRLYGGFWMNLPASDRLRGLRIDGAGVVSLDFGQTGLRIVYAMAGAVPSWKDGYAIPGLEGCRDGVKRLVHALLNADAPLTRYPKQVRRLFPESVPLATAVSRIKAAHPPIEKILSPRIGMSITYMESEILVDVLLRLIDLGVVALPVHDALVVQATHEDLTKAVMLAVFKEHTGLNGQVRVEYAPVAVST